MVAAGAIVPLIPGAYFSTQALDNSSAKHRVNLERSLPGNMLNALHRRRVSRAARAQPVWGSVGRRAVKAGRQLCAASSEGRTRY